MKSDTRKTVFVVVFEGYRITMGSLQVVLAVTRPVEKFFADVNLPLYRTSVVLNFVSLFLFILMYGIEIRREKRLRNYLSYSGIKPITGNQFMREFALLTLDRRQKLLKLHYFYARVAVAASIIFVANSLISGLYLGLYYLNQKEITTFLTNLLFVGQKLYSIMELNQFDVSKRVEEVCTSAYLHHRVIYNVANRLKSDIPSPTDERIQVVPVSEMYIHKIENGTPNPDKAVEPNKECQDAELK